MFQWAVDFPDFMKGLIATDTAPKDTFDSGPAARRLIEEFSADPNWNDGDYYATGGLEEALTALRIRVLRSYGFEERLDKTLPEAERAAIVARTAREWAREFDAHSLVTLYRAWSRSNVEDRFDRVRAQLLFILCDTDEWFPAREGPAVMERLRNAGVDATFHEIHSALGHYATSEEPEKWTPLARDFLRRLQG